MNLNTVAVLATVLLGSVSIPFLTNSVTITAVDDFREGLVPILNESVDEFSTSDANRYLGGVSKSFGANEFSFQTETAFGTFMLEITNDENITVKQSLVNPEVSIERLVVNDGELQESWKLVTNAFTISSYKNFSSVVEEFRNPEGDCKKVRSLGTVQEECHGEVSKIEKNWDRAKKMLQDYMEKIRNVSSTIEIPNIRSDEWDF
jgi:hypothetical protein